MGEALWLPRPWERPCRVTPRLGSPRAPVLTAERPAHPHAPSALRVEQMPHGPHLLVWTDTRGRHSRGDGQGHKASCALRGPTSA